MNDGPTATQHFLDIAGQHLPNLIQRKRVLQLRRGDQLVDLLGQSKHLYLIDTALISLGAGLADGRSAEVALLGHGALLGLASVHAWGVMPYRATVQRAGTIMQFHVGGIQNEILLSTRLGEYMRYVLNNIFVQITQSALCNRHHHIEQQLAKLLLQYQDLTNLDEIPLTQQGLSDLIGVRREGVTQAIGKLYSLGVIESRRGSVRIRHRIGLQEQACECYQHVARTFEYVAPPKRARVATNAPPQRRLSAINSAPERAKTPEIAAAFRSALG